MVREMIVRETIFGEKTMTNRQKYREGMANGVPIALGYFAVAFTLISTSSLSVSAVSLVISVSG